MKSPPPANMIGTATTGLATTVRWSFVLVTALLLTVHDPNLSAPSDQHLRHSDPPLARDRLAVVKAGALRHLPGHTEWPDDRFNDTEHRRDAIVFTVIGNDSFSLQRRLDEILQGERAHDRKIVLQWVQFPRPQPAENEPSDEDLDAFRALLHRSHIVYLGETERACDRYRDVLKWIEGSSTLTVSAIDEFVKQGGMLRLSFREDHLAIDANAEAIRRAGLRVSSRLLRFARVVTMTESDDRSTKAEQ